MDDCKFKIQKLMLFLLRAWSIQLNNLVFTKYEEVIKAFIPNGIVPQKEIF